MDTAVCSAGHLCKALCTSHWSRRTLAWCFRHCAWSVVETRGSVRTFSQVCGPHSPSPPPSPPTLICKQMIVIWRYLQTRSLNNPADAAVRAVGFSRSANAHQRAAGRESGTAPFCVARRRGSTPTRQPVRRPKSGSVPSLIRSTPQARRSGKRK